MEYEWEKKVRTQIDFDAIEALLPDGYFLAGLAIADDESVEACLWRCDIYGPSISDADIWKDISGDAERLYAESVDAMNRTLYAQSRQN